MKKIHLLFAIAIIVILFASGCTLPTEERLNCQKSGGQWIGFSNSGADKCRQIGGADVITHSCDCGPDNCWDGKNCIPNGPKK